MYLATSHRKFPIITNIKQVPLTVLCGEAEVDKIQSLSQFLNLIKNYPFKNLSENEIQQIEFRVWNIMQLI